MDTLQLVNLKRQQITNTINLCTPNLIKNHTTKQSDGNTDLFIKRKNLIT